MRAHCLGKPRASDPVGDGRTDQCKRRLRLLLASGFSAVLMIAASSRLVARFGSRRILAAGVLSAAAGLVTAAGAADCWCLAAAFVLFGLGEGLWDVAVNVQAMSGQRR